MTPIVLLTIVIVLALAAAAGLWLLLSHEEKAVPQKAEPPKQPRVKKTAEEKKEPAKEKPYPLPPSLPRTRATIKLLAQESPDVVANIVKKWLRGKK